MMSSMYAYLAIISLAATPVTSVTHDDAVHVGCFKTNLVDTQRSYYMVNEPLKWENGISACIHRYTTHVGVQADNRTPSMSFFFCGNDLLEHSVKLEDSACAPCVDRTDRLCGGAQSLSLYKIRDSTPLVILVANRQGIRLLEVDGSHTNFSNPIPTNTSAVRIDLMYSKDEFVFQNEVDLKLYKSFFGSQLNKYSTPLEFVGNTHNYGLTVDWLNKQIYFCGDLQRVMVYDMSKENTRQLFTTVSRCRDLAVDPFSRTLIIVFENGTLSSFSLLTQEFHIYKGGEYGLRDVRGVTLDYESQLMYVDTRLAASDPDTRYLVRLDYADTLMTIVYQGSEFDDSYGLDVFKGSIVWERGDRIYICRLNPNCEKKDVIELHNYDPELAYISDITIYHPLKQTPTERYLCESAGCSHSCSRGTLFTAKCTCPEGLTLGTDFATCQVPAAYCGNHEFLQVGYKINRQDIMSAVRNEDIRDHGSCKWESSPRNGFNFQPCLWGLCMVIEGSYKIRCSLRFTRCDPHYVLVGGRDRDSCDNGKWTTSGHQCIPCGRSQNSFNPHEDLALIHNGNISFRGDFPWMAALYYRLDGEHWDQICGGTLISPNLVLTAAHCLVLRGRNFKTEDVRVGLGKLYRNYHHQENISRISTVKEIVRQERYRGVDHWFDLDIALLVLSSSLVTGTYIMPACVDWGAAMEPKNNEVGYVAGWGNTEQNTTSAVLKWATQNYLQYNTCLTLVNPKDKKIITHDKFCVNQVNGGMADKGDSGGGLTMLRDGAHYIYGVLSTKLPSENQNIRLFTSVLNAGHLDWLRTEWNRHLLSS